MVERGQGEGDLVERILGQLVHISDNLQIQILYTIFFFFLTQINMISFKKVPSLFSNSNM